MQIGPRIRVGGTLGKIGEKIKSVVPSPASMVGHAMGGPWQIAASAMNHSLGDDLKKGVTNASIIGGAKQTVDAFQNGGAGPGIKSAADFLGGHGDLASQAKDWLTGNGGMNALGLAQGINVAGLQKQSTDMANKAVGGLEDSYNNRAPLRVAGLQGMLNPQTANVGGLNAHAGPYGKGLPAIAPAKQFGGG